MSMTSDEIRDTYRQFFEEHGHLAQRGASLIPPANDTSAMFIVAGMHPLKSYFAGTEQPPSRRLTTCQPAFRTVDIENVGMTARHLTMFEMLGNFSFGDYFKREAISFAWELSRNGFGLNEDDIWVTVFGGDEELGIGPDQEAIDLWLEVGMPRERIVECPREENFWESGPTGPCGPDSELYLDLGVERGKLDDLPGGENERFLEFWNLVFMQYDQNPPRPLTPLPNQNIDTGLGLNRMAAIKQGKETVFETDQFAPLIALGEELSAHRYGESFEVDRALRILADHSRAATFLIADGVVPSNEDRGYVLRRIMRRAILQGSKTLGMDPGFLQHYQGVVTELMGREYGQLARNAESVSRWLNSEEEGFGRTLEEGSKLLDDLIARAKERGDEGISAEDAFRLHDTHGFPIDLTLELVTEHGLGVNEQGFEQLMEQQRQQSRASGARSSDTAGLREQAAALAGSVSFKTDFKGYEAISVETTVGAIQDEDGRTLVKLLESPFYATGGGQVADSGFIECEDGDCLARVEDVVRVGDDQILAVVPERGTLKHGERVHARVDRNARHATACNHTATHLLHAALRQRLGSHVHQAGSYVGPDKLRFDFTHNSGLSPDELRDIENQVNDWILGAYAVRAITTTLDEARSLGAMALFGEKYGDIVRMVEVGGAGGGGWDSIVSRELCGGTHVHSTAEIGLLAVFSETSSAANVRRIEAVTGPVAIKIVRQHGHALGEAAKALRVTPDGVPAAVQELRDRVKQLEKQLKAGGGAGGGVDEAALLAAATALNGGHLIATTVDGVAGQELLDLADRLKAKLGDAAIVLGAVSGDKVDIVASVAPTLVERGVRAGEIVRAAAAEVGGGGGGKDTAARAGGRDIEKLPNAITVARQAVEAALG
ncbi:MAG TPA: alanine--tRNA ligase [Solirubrobacteraceae bacterium]|nr:alanine--tRNA ligase [Solirubrobacteraceae bacterium]